MIDDLDIHFLRTSESLWHIYPAQGIPPDFIPRLLGLMGTQSLPSCGLCPPSPSSMIHPILGMTLPTLRNPLTVPIRDHGSLITHANPHLLTIDDD